MTPRTAITANKIPTATPAAIDVSFPRCFGLKLLNGSKLILKKGTELGPFYGRSFNPHALVAQKIADQR